MAAFDALVANAEVASLAPLADGELEDWNAMIDVNLRGMLHGVAAALPRFTAQSSGHFITVTSTSAIKRVPGQGVDAATKAGVRALCEVLRQEVGPDIRVTMVCPGATATSPPGLTSARSSCALPPRTPEGFVRTGSCAPRAATRLRPRRR